MAIISISAYPMNKAPKGILSLTLSRVAEAPSHKVEVKTIADVQRELDAYAAQFKGTGKPWCVMASHVKSSGRKVAGFDKADTRRYVNEELAWE